MQDLNMWVWCQSSEMFIVTFWLKMSAHLHTILGWETGTLKYCIVKGSM